MQAGIAVLLWLVVGVIVNFSIVEDLLETMDDVADQMRLDPAAMKLETLAVLIICAIAWPLTLVAKICRIARKNILR